MWVMTIVYEHTSTTHNIPGTTHQQTRRTQNNTNSIQTQKPCNIHNLLRDIERHTPRHTRHQVQHAHQYNIITHNIMKHKNITTNIQHEICTTQHKMATTHNTYNIPNTLYVKKYITHNTRASAHHIIHSQYTTHHTITRHVV